MGNLNKCICRMEVLNQIQLKTLSQFIKKGDPSRVFITWLTFDDTLDSLVEYGLDFARLDKTMAAKVDYFLDGGTEKVKRYTHRALLEGIRPGQRYCGDFEKDYF